jgi:hypothetical protein
MQRSNLLRRHALLTAVMIIFGSAADGVPVKGDEMGDEMAPAQLVTLCGGELASELAAFKPRLPVLVAYAGNHWRAVMFAKNPAECPLLLETLLVADVPGCVGEGAIMCCDSMTQTMVLHVTYQGQPLWVRLGEICKEPPDHELGVKVVAVPPALTKKLFDEVGITDEYMDLPDSEGRARMLWNSPPISGELSLPPVIQTSGPFGPSSISPVVTAEARSPILLAHHSPNGCVGDVDDECENNYDLKRCHPTQKHWFRLTPRPGGLVWSRRIGCRCE